MTILIPGIGAAAKTIFAKDESTTKNRREIIDFFILYFLKVRSIDSLELCERRSAHK
jgi:hypothetical protein